MSIVGLTNDRTVSVTWDKTQNSIVESALLLRRISGENMFPSAQTNIIQLANGLRCLAPENDIRILADSTTAQQYILRLENDYTFADFCKEVPRGRALSELVNIGADADVATTGDWYVTKRISAGAPWDEPLTPVEPGPSFPFGVFQYPLDPNAMAPKNGIFEGNQGFLIRILIPGSLGRQADVIFSFRFGGEIHASGYGKFEFFVTGDGVIHLNEKLGAGWSSVGSWQFTDHREMAASHLTIRVIPAWPKHVEFRTFAGQGLDGSIRSVSDSGMAQNLLQAADWNQIGSHAFEVTRPESVARVGGTGELRPITGPGRILVSVRRDLRLHWQVSRIAYRETGSVTDRPYVIPAGVETSRVVRLRLLGYQPTGFGTITGTLQESDGSALPTANETFTLNSVAHNYSGFQPPGGLNKMRAVVTLTNTQTAGSRWQTPFLEGYEVQRAPVQGTYSLGEKTGGGMIGLHIFGASYRPDTEHATVTIEDPSNQIPTVRTRRSPVRIETTYDPLNPTRKACLFDGWTERVTAALKGKHGRVWPRETWHRIDAELVGQWERLANNRFTSHDINLADASSHPLGRGGNVKVAWKVVEAIWWVLYASGFSADQLDIPDDPMRFPISGTDTTIDTLLVRAGSVNIGTLAAEWARFYLGQYLVWDGGAGPTGQGMWRLKRQPTAASTPLWTFTLADAPANKLAHMSASYGSRISPILDVDGVDFRSWTEFPEANIVQVYGRVQVLPTGGRHVTWQQMINWRSFYAPGREGLGQPNSVDWIGDVMPIIVRDESLPTQESVNFVCRRLFEAACFGRVFHSFAAELVIADVSATETFHVAPYTHRTLGPGDPVNLVDMDGVTTKCVVHSANFSIDEKKEWNQLGYFEIEEFQPNRTIGGLQ